MARIILDNEHLWKWMAIGKSKDDTGTLDDFLRLIADNQVNEDYIIKLKKENYLKQPDDIMKNLSLMMPREYFLELQFCAKTIAALFGTIFPPLASHIEQLAYIEWLLYTEPGYTKYRDHLVHMFKVAFAGHCLLSYHILLEKICLFQFQSQHFEKWIKDKFHISEEEHKEIIRMAFFLAAIFHDFGYGYYFHNRYQQRLYKINDWLLPGPDLTDINGPLFQKFKTSLPYSYIEDNHLWCSKSDKLNDTQKPILISGFFRDCLPLNHSIASTFTIMNIVKNLWDVGALNDKLYLAFQLAAEAIMIHDMTCRHNWMHLNFGKKDHFLDSQSYKEIPISVLLILADELAVWNRFEIKPVHSGNYQEIRYKIDQEFVPKKIEIEMLDKKLQLKPYYRTTKGRNRDILRKKIKEDLDFFKHNESPMFMDYEIEFAATSN
jgi:hypothetical protein